MKNLFFVLMLISTTAQAKLGDTVAQIEARYGKAITNAEPITAGAKRYKYEGYEIEVVFLNGKSCCEDISGTEKKPVEFNDTLAFGFSIGGRKDWKLVWSKTEGTLQAEYESGDLMLIFTKTKYGYGDASIRNTQYTAFHAAQEKREKTIRDKSIDDKFGNSK